MRMIIDHCEKETNFKQIILRWQKIRAESLALNRRNEKKILVKKIMILHIQGG